MQPPGRLLRAARLAVGCLAAVALLPVITPAEAASRLSIAVSPTSAKPGQVVTVSGVISACPLQGFQTAHNYTDFKGNAVQSNGMPGMTDASGAFSFMTTVPTGAVRSNLFRPFADFTYDTVVLRFQACGDRVIGVSVYVRPFSHKVELTVTPASPRSGRLVHVTATHCRNGPLPEFTQLVDRTGEYFHFSGSVSGSTYTGTANLAHGFYGAFAPGGPAHPSPRGVKDAVISVPCVQDDGPKSVAVADRLWHSNVVVDVHIRKRS